MPFSENKNTTGGNYSILACLSTCSAVVGAAEADTQLSEDISTLKLLESDCRNLRNSLSHNWL